MGEDKDLDDASFRLERLGIGLPKVTSFDGSHSPPIATSHGHLSTDIQARIMAFQQKRQHVVPSKPKDVLAGKALPSLPGTKTRTALASIAEANPISGGIGLQLPENPGESLASPLITLKGATELAKKPLLSQRRGMKLNMKSFGSPTSALPEPALLTGDLPRTAGSEKKRPDLKLDFSDPALGSNTGDSDTPASSAKSLSPAQLHGLFADYSKYIDVKSGLLNFAGKASLHSEGVNFSSGSSFLISLHDMQCIEELGRGNYGTVSKVLHKPTGVLMAMKEVRLELEDTKFTQILMELEVLHKCKSPFIVDFYGAFFVEGAVYMCMEYMDGGSLDKVYGDGIHDEACLAYITEGVIRGLKELKDVHNIIHRDIKPTNILVNSEGKVKLCDFGVSGNLVASLAKTNIGCQSYMAPERIKTMNPDDATYSVQSDIWSLGLTILEVAAGRYPYPPETYDNIFSQLGAIVDGDPPKLNAKHFSKEAQMFVRSCLNKNPDLRPPYDVLLQSPWLTHYRGVESCIARLVQDSIATSKNDKRIAEGKSQESPRLGVNVSGVATKGRENVNSLLKGKVNAPALHRGGLGTQRVRR